ncbi:MAG TPA: pirin family protein [Acidimicrobiia bacterium]|nr:pirin family protein [Acidimicrobiia bacterium]
MSGPIGTPDVVPATDPPGLNITTGRRTQVGGIPVSRALPQQQRRTVGAWCFADHFGPADVPDHAMLVGPHPHIGLHTVTWVLDGEVLHHDSLGNEQLIKPGQLNLMTAGAGVAHAEETPDGATGSLHGLQLWVAQPDATRHGPAAFEHHATLPGAELGRGALSATVLVGELAGARSPARADTPLVGADLAVRARATLPLDPAFEHGLLAVGGPFTVDGQDVAADAFAYLTPGRSAIDLAPGRRGDTARVLILGGVPFTEPVLMWWNFVARTKEEMAAARSAWESGHADRFGPVETGLARIPAPPPLWDRPGMRPAG